ncbi:MAG: hypothetical protein ACRDLB_06585 [Actinomycetota bacterium]
MSTASFRPSDIAFAEALVRVEAHLENALLLLESGRVQQALVQASRPMIEHMPRLSRELWDAPEVGTHLNRAVGAIANGIRTGGQAPRLRAALAAAEDAVVRATETVVGPAHSDPAFVSSVVVAVLRTATEAHRAATGEAASGETASGGRFVRIDAIAYVRRARARCSEIDVTGPDDPLGPLFDDLQRSIGAEETVDPAYIEGLVAQISQVLQEHAGARLGQEPAVADYLDRVAELVAGAATTYGAGDAFRADKLAARAYVENYAVVRDTLHSADGAAESVLEECLRDLRLRMRAEASVEEVADIARRARSALTSLRSVI